MNPTILYVEDDAENREIMRLLVEEILGFTGLTIFADSENFIERLEALMPKPDIILLDIHVPPYDGFQMLSMIRAHAGFQDTPVAALTASVMNEEVNQLKTAGFDGVIAKPLDMDNFPAALYRITNGETVWDIAG